jgi:NADPH-dependent 2,4-dienoyl-CoA reductase/sulfur reductase-like enzyme/nitrite reductase/ring-hydroxylating ferredoxin subunit
MTQHEHDVTAALDAIEPGQMRAVEIEGQSVLLVRDGETVHALGATCPHAGGPLAEGVRCGDRLVCPWHKATFSLNTGTVLEPPAMDPLPRHQVRIANGRVLVTLAEIARSEVASGDDRCFVIVGAGAAGAVAAQTLREAGFGGRVLMLDRDNRVPYDRTILSKYALSGETGGEKSPLQSQSFYRDQRIERITAEVSAVDAAARRITCADGTVFAYDAALLATGGEPRRADLPGAGLGNVFVLRSRADADAILAQAERSARAVILGAGFIGMEVAASLRERGLDVTVIGREAVPFEKQLGREVGAAFVSLHAKRGVTFRTASRVAALEGGPDVRAVRLENGDRIPADLVVIGVGIAPATGYARALPCAEDGSLVVDARLRVADALYAAGDIARFPLRGHGASIRVEHWRVAQQHGRVAALNMLGRGMRYDAVPVFWTIQYLKRLDYVGHASEWDEIVLHGDADKPKFIAYYIKEGHVAAAAGLDRDRDMAALIELFTLRRRWRAADLGASPATVLETLPAS